MPTLGMLPTRVYDVLCQLAEHDNMTNTHVEKKTGAEKVPVVDRASDMSCYVMEATYRYPKMTTDKY